MNKVIKESNSIYMPTYYSNNNLVNFLKVNFKFVVVR